MKIKTKIAEYYQKHKEQFKTNAREGLIYFVGFSAGLASLKIVSKQYGIDGVKRILRIK